MNSEDYSVEYIEGPADGATYVGPELVEGTLSFNELWPVGSYYEYHGGAMVWHPPSDATLL